ncbi:uroporphyrinogen-III synthase [Lipingzhangella sp. LS1_29]|uniref:Uroporphyrinogen-III synthase n=1 Tax=Lipingzhangella rawalii TaxID=2055835 RepID=A0ABU2H6C8_9ACTN|nr:uroporphyrinogen-III synthase [Lipingzhangella rawalii]MDS1270863.1 uroporphyrinogen-III synthase [Lipingzhangella rawalii]
MTSSQDLTESPRDPGPAGQLAEDAGPLSGFTIGVTAARRAEELATLLQRRGAEVIHGAAVRIVPLSDDERLVETSRDLARRPADLVVATTGIGFRGWVEACESWGLAAPLVAGMSQSRILARGPKAKGAVRAAGLREEWSPPSESSAEVLEYLLERGVAGLRIAVQLHGEPLPDFCSALRMAGAEVVEVPVYRWTTPLDVAPLDRLIGAVVAGEVDALTFTSAPAAAGTLDRARRLGCGRELEEALRGRVLAMCVGPVTAGPLRDRDIPTVWPQRGRIGAQVNRLGEELASRCPVLPVAGHQLQVRGHAALLDAQLCPISPAPMRLLRELAQIPGRVRSREELLGVLDSGGDPHAVETAVARLRQALGDSRIVQTVVKRGYRLALDPGECAEAEAGEEP